jgi:hypothetical protein
MDIPTMQAGSGTVSVEVKLQHISDVYLVDENNFRKKQVGMAFSYFGGSYNQSPVHITAKSPVPTTWYLFVTNGESYQYRWL